MNMKIKYFAVILILVVFACSEEKPPTPKPSTVLRLEIPENEYFEYTGPCSFVFDVNKLYRIDTLTPKITGDAECYTSIDLPPFNSTLQLWHYKLKDANALEFYINTTLDIMEERHQVVATGIKDKRFIRSEDRVFGTLFELQGNVATPFQFYLTDSTDNFILGEVLINFRPNYDSLVPSLTYIKRDMEQIMNSLTWKQ